MEDYTAVSASEYAKLRKRRKTPVPGRNQKLLAEFISGEKNHAVIFCDSYAAARVRYQSLRNTSVRFGLPVKIEQRRENVLISKL